MATRIQLDHAQALHDDASTPKTRLSGVANVVHYKFTLDESDKVTAIIMSIRYEMPADVDGAVVNNTKDVEM